MEARISFFLYRFHKGSPYTDDAKVLKEQALPGLRKHKLRFANEVYYHTTVVTTSQDEAKEALRRFGRAVSKPLFGYKGRDIPLLESGDPSDLALLLPIRWITKLETGEIGSEDLCVSALSVVWSRVCWSERI